MLNNQNPISHHISTETPTCANLKNNERERNKIVIINITIKLDIEHKDDEREKDRITNTNKGSLKLNHNKASPQLKYGC